MKPRIFIGSSTEGLPVAYAIHNNLDRDAEVTVWTQDVFKPSKFILESLLEKLDNIDIGIFVFVPTDAVKMRGVEYASVRDNVIFEYGLYVGRLGRDRSFIVAPAGEPLHLPSDLLGMNYLTYHPHRTDANLDAALAPNCNKIRAILLEIDPKHETIPPELRLTFSERRDLLSAKQREILGVIEKMPITFKELSKVFSEISTEELAYRLDHLRFQMFISTENNKTSSEPYGQTFGPSVTYQKFLKTRGIFPFGFSIGGYANYTTNSLDNFHSIAEFNKNKEK